MSFNLNYVTQGIDFTAFGQGIAQGISMAVQKKEQQDKMFDSEWKEFSRMFDPSKISDSDRDDYIQAYSETHKIAKELNRAERGGSTEKINELDLQLQKAQSKMASIYGRSKMKNEKVLTINKEIERLQKSGYVVPTDYKIYRNSLTTKRALDITDDELEGDFKIDLMPTPKQNAETMSMFDKSKTSFVRLNEKQETIDLPVVGKVTINKYMPGFGADESSIRLNENSIEKTNHINYGVDTLKWLKQNLLMPDGTKEKEGALSFAQNLMKKAKLNSLDQIQAKHIAADSLGLYNIKESGKEVIDDSDLTMKMKKFSILNAQEKNRISEGFLRVAQERANTDKDLSSDMRFYSFIMKNDSVPVLRNSPVVQKMLKDRGMDPNSFANAVESYHQKGLSGFESAIQAYEDQKATKNE